MMKKIFTAILMGAVSMGLLSGCAFCRKPQLDSCVPPQADHGYSQTIAPSPVTVAQPIVLPSGDVFRPVFRADAKRVTATGIGDSPEEARNNAVVNFTAASYLSGYCQIEVYEGIGIILWQMKNHVELLYSHMKMVSGNM